MYKQSLIIGLLFLSFISCKKDNTDNILNGLYTENTPVPGRSQLNFISNNLLIKSEAGSSTKDTFDYSFSTDKITLTPVWTNQFPEQQFHFKKIDENSFQIENLYPAIPEAPKSYMIYKK